MYFSDQHQTVGAVGSVSRTASWWRLGLVGSNVLFLGLTSMFTDISSEMVAAVLPIYLTFELGWSALHFGIFDGLYQGMSILLRLAGGLIADRHQRYKEVASTGYALSTGCKLGLLAVQGAWLPTTVCMFLDRIGKGIRTAPRDTLIALSSPRSTRAEAFGVHRAFDSAGAMLGPLLAFGLLGLFPGDFHGIFIVSFGMGLLGLATLVVFVDNRLPASIPKPAPSTRSWRSTLDLLWMRSFRRLLLAAAPLSLLSISDAFVYLTFQRLSDLNVSFFPLLYLGTALIYLILAIPLGRLADQVGRWRVFLAGYVGLLGVYAILLLPQLESLALLACLILFGTYYAATEGVLMAVASELLPPAQLTSGLALLTTVVILSRLVASVLYGVLWSWQGPRLTLCLFIIGLSASMLCAALIFSRQPGPAPNEDQ
jgi:MFS family permease